MKRGRYAKTVDNEKTQQIRVSAFAKNYLAQRSAKLKVSLLKVLDEMVKAQPDVIEEPEDVKSRLLVNILADDDTGPMTGMDEEQ